jgi:hypothetical protein
VEGGFGGMDGGVLDLAFLRGLPSTALAAARAAAATVREQVEVAARRRAAVAGRAA